MGSVIALGLTVFVPTAEAQQSCPTSPPVVAGGSLPELRSSPPILIDMQPCQTVVVQLTASSGSNPSGSAAMALSIQNAAGQSLAWDNGITCGSSCTVTLPLPGQWWGDPVPGMVGSGGHPYAVVVSTGWFNWFASSQVTYQVTITKQPRQGYNQGGTDYASALSINPRETQRGSVHFYEPGQFYKIHLETGQTVFARGHATGPHVGSVFQLALYNPAQQFVKMLAQPLATDTPVEFPAVGASPPLYTNTTGSAGDFYVIAYVSPWDYPTLDFDFEIATPYLTVDSETPTRGDNVTFTVVDAPGGAVSNWHYDITDPSALGTVTRTVDTGATTWPGQLVASGTATVTVGLGGGSVQLEKHVDVNPRNWTDFAPVPPTKRANGYVTSCGPTMTYTDPGTGGAGIGKTEFCLGYSISGPEFAFVSGGPNDGVKWLLDVHDATQVNWGMHPDAENSGSAFWQANCGNFAAGPGNTCTSPNGTGFMLASDFRDQVERHEVGPSNSHYAFYVTESSNPSRSIRRHAEPIVAPPSTTLGTFVNIVSGILTPLENQIKNAIAADGEPCGPLCDGSCAGYIGNPNLRNGSGNYAACPVPGLQPSPLSIQLFTPKGRVR